VNIWSAAKFASEVLVAIGGTGGTGNAPALSTRLPPPQALNKTHVATALKKRVGLRNIVNPPGYSDLRSSSTKLNALSTSSTASDVPTTIESYTNFEMIKRISEQIGGPIAPLTMIYG
jgi:hypothetical protein